MDAEKLSNEIENLIEFNITKFDQDDPTEEIVQALEWVLEQWRDKLSDFE